MKANGQKKKKDLPYYNNVQRLNIDDKVLDKPYYTYNIGCMLVVIIHNYLLIIFT